MRISRRKTPTRRGFWFSFSIMLAVGLIGVTAGFIIKDPSVSRTSFALVSGALGMAAGRRMTMQECMDIQNNES